ncbi:MAG: Fic/DOC family protein [Candidatus Nanopelagicales bacterium]
MSSPHRFDRPEDFLYPGTNVLRNRLNITDAEELERAERALTFGRLVELRSTGAGAGDFDFAHLQAIHRHVFQDVYEWAGQVREVTLGKGTTQFCLPQHLESLAATIFSGLASEDLLMGLTKEQFDDAAANLLADLNALHPFREGNGRAQRAFLELLSDRAGHPIVWPPIGPDRMIQASIDAMRGDNSALRAIVWESSA